ncbi:MAG: peptide chain release factor 2 [Chloroflexota bacterium]
MENLHSRLTDMDQRIGSTLCVFDLADKVKQAEALEKETGDPNFWNDQREAQAKMRHLSDLREEVDTWQGLSRRIKDALDLIDMAAAEEDDSLLAELSDEVESLAEQLDKLEFQLLFSGEHDKDAALLSIHAGAGGTESQDWAQMLMRMYTRWAEARGYDPELVDITVGEEAGIKSVTLEISGDYVYGYLKAERGVHRLVRISPFDASSRRHTSFALVEVVPDLETDIDIDLNPDDLEIDVYKSGGAGGQHVQKNATAIRIKHRPTGIVVTCQNERSQLQNKETAMRILRGRLYDLELKKQEEEQARLKGQHVEAGWGNQIRSYVLHPYKMVKDHRTSHEVGNAEAVLDGRLDDFIEAYLRHTIGDYA